MKNFLIISISVVLLTTLSFFTNSYVTNPNCTKTSCVYEYTNEEKEMFIKVSTLIKFSTIHIAIWSSSMKSMQLYSKVHLVIKILQV
jgi:hypothetical protein